MPRFTNTPARPQTTEAYQSSCQIRRQKRQNNYEPRNVLQNSEPSSLRMASMCQAICCIAHSVNTLSTGICGKTTWCLKPRKGKDHAERKKKSQKLKKKNGFGGWNGGADFIRPYTLFPKNVSVRCMCFGYKLTGPCTGWDFAKDWIKKFHHQVFTAMQAKKKQTKKKKPNTSIQWIMGEETQIYFGRRSHVLLHVNKPDSGNNPKKNTSQKCFAAAKSIILTG